jgi:hypothetical protein
MNAHEWRRDPKQHGEGLRCVWCGVTEAEMAAASGRLDECPS